MINYFLKEYFFLSNFYKTEVPYEEIVYQSSEAAFQATKTLNSDERNKFAGMNPSVAKEAGQKVFLRSGWENVKDKVMYDVCFSKFNNNESLKTRLLATGDEELVEGNTWHDNYWGNCTCDKCIGISGRNQLGKTLMQIRSDIRKGEMR